MKILKDANENKEKDMHTKMIEILGKAILLFADHKDLLRGFMVFIPKENVDLMAKIDKAVKNAKDKASARARELQQATAQQAVAKEEKGEEGGKKKRRQNLKGYASKSARRRVKRKIRKKSRVSIFSDGNGDGRRDDHERRRGE